MASFRSGRQIKPPQKFADFVRMDCSNTGLKGSINSKSKHKKPDSGRDETEGDIQIDHSTDASTVDEKLKLFKDMSKDVQPDTNTEVENIVNRSTEASNESTSNPRPQDGVHIQLKDGECSMVATNCETIDSSVQHDKHQHKLKFHCSEEIKPSVDNVDKSTFENINMKKDEITSEEKSVKTVKFKKITPNKLVILKPYKSSPRNIANSAFKTIPSENVSPKMKEFSSKSNEVLVENNSKVLKNNLKHIPDNSVPLDTQNVNRENTFTFCSPVKNFTGFPPVNTSKVCSSVNTSSVYTSVNTSKVFPSVNTYKVYPSVNISKVYPSVNTSKVYPPVNKFTDNPLVNTSTACPHVNTSKVFSSVNTSAVCPPVNTSKVGPSVNTCTVSPPKNISQTCQSVNISTLHPPVNKSIDNLHVNISTVCPSVNKSAVLSPVNTYRVYSPMKKSIACVPANTSTVFPSVNRSTVCMPGSTSTVCPTVGTSIDCLPMNPSSIALPWRMKAVNDVSITMDSLSSSVNLDLDIAAADSSCSSFTKNFTKGEELATNIDCEKASLLHVQSHRLQSPPQTVGDDFIKQVASKDAKPLICNESFSRENTFNDQSTTEKSENPSLPSCVNLNSKISIEEFLSNNINESLEKIENDDNDSTSDESDPRPTLPSSNNLNESFDKIENDSTSDESEPRLMQLSSTAHESDPKPTQSSSASDESDPTSTQSSSASDESDPTPMQLSSTSDESDPTPTQLSSTSDESNPTPTQLSSTTDESDPTPTQLSSTSDESDPRPTQSSSTVSIFAEAKSRKLISHIEKFEKNSQDCLTEEQTNLFDLLPNKNSSNPISSSEKNEDKLLLKTEDKTVNCSSLLDKSKSFNNLRMEECSSNFENAMKSSTLNKNQSLSPSKQSLGEETLPVTMKKSKKLFVPDKCGNLISISTVCVKSQNDFNSITLSKEKLAKIDAINSRNISLADKTTSQEYNDKHEKSFEGFEPNVNMRKLSVKNVTLVPVTTNELCGSSSVPTEIEERENIAQNNSLKEMVTISQNKLAKEKVNCNKKEPTMRNLSEKIEEIKNPQNKGKLNMMNLSEKVNITQKEEKSNSKNLSEGKARAMEQSDMTNLSEKVTTQSSPPYNENEPKKQNSSMKTKAKIEITRSKFVETDMKDNSSESKLLSLEMWKKSKHFDDSSSKKLFGSSISISYVTTPKVAKMPIINDTSDDLSKTETVSEPKIKTNQNVLEKPKFEKNSNPNVTKFRFVPHNDFKCFNISKHDDVIYLDEMPKEHKKGHMQPEGMEVANNMQVNNDKNNPTVDENVGSKKYGQGTYCKTVLNSQPLESLSNTNEIYEPKTRPNVDTKRPGLTNSMGRKDQTELHKKNLLDKNTEPKNVLLSKIQNAESNDISDSNSDEIQFISQIKNGSSKREIHKELQTTATSIFDREKSLSTLSLGKQIKNGTISLQRAKLYSLPADQPRETYELFEPTSQTSPKKIALLSSRSGLPSRRLQYASNEKRSTISLLNRKKRFSIKSMHQASRKLAFSDEREVNRSENDIREVNSIEASKPTSSNIRKKIASFAPAKRSQLRLPSAYRRISKNQCLKKISHYAHSGKIKERKVLSNKVFPPNILRSPQNEIGKPTEKQECDAKPKKVSEIAPSLEVLRKSTRLPKPNAKYNDESFENEQSFGWSKTTSFKSNSNEISCVTPKDKVHPVKSCDEGKKVDAPSEETPKLGNDSVEKSDAPNKETRKLENCSAKKSDAPNKETRKLENDSVKKSDAPSKETPKPGNGYFTKNDAPSKETNKVGNDSVKKSDTPSKETPKLENDSVKKSIAPNKELPKVGSDSVKKRKSPDIEIIEIIDNITPAKRQKNNLIVKKSTKDTPMPLSKKQKVNNGHSVSDVVKSNSMVKKSTKDTPMPLSKKQKINNDHSILEKSSLNNTFSKLNDTPDTKNKMINVSNSNQSNLKEKTNLNANANKRKTGPKSRVNVQKQLSDDSLQVTKGKTTSPKDPKNSLAKCIVSPRTASNYNLKEAKVLLNRLAFKKHCPLNNPTKMITESKNKTQCKSLVNTNSLTNKKLLQPNSFGGRSKKRKLILSSNERKDIDDRKLVASRARHTKLTAPFYTSYHHFLVNTSTPNQPIIIKPPEKPKDHYIDQDDLKEYKKLGSTISESISRAMMRNDQTVFGNSSKTVENKFNNLLNILTMKGDKTFDDNELDSLMQWVEEDELEKVAYKRQILQSLQACYTTNMSLYTEVINALKID